MPRRLWGVRRRPPRGSDVRQHFVRDATRGELLELQLRLLVRPVPASHVGNVPRVVARGRRLVLPALPERARRLAGYVKYMLRIFFSAAFIRLCAAAFEMPNTSASVSR